MFSRKPQIFRHKLFRIITESPRGRTIDKSHEKNAIETFKSYVDCLVGIFYTKSQFSEKI